MTGLNELKYILNHSKLLCIKLDGKNPSINKGVNVATVACVVDFPAGRHYVEITKKDDSASTSRSSELKKPQIRCDKRTTAQKVNIIKPKRASHDCSRRDSIFLNY